MKIGIDVDNVVVDLNKGFIDFYNSNFDKNISMDDFKEHYYLSDLFGISRDEEWDLWNSYHNSELFDEMSFVEGVKAAIDFLKAKHELFFITARHLSWKDKTDKLFEKHFGDVNLIFSGDVYGGRQKDEICEENGIKILVEDHPTHSLDYAKKGIKILLFDRPWNKKVEHENIIRVKNWEEILERIKNIDLENDS